jgi:endoplasmic reticulum Man9GlcNAc2 1,2-alpha-mannosidase
MMHDICYGRFLISLQSTSALILRTICRPETVESLFIAHRLTGHPQYRKWGWQIFQGAFDLSHATLRDFVDMLSLIAIEKHCKLEAGGYATVLNVDWEVIKHDDKMETFFMVRIHLYPYHAAALNSFDPLQSETLKYLYLLFDDASKLSLSGT